MIFGFKVLRFRVLGFKVFRVYGFWVFGVFRVR